MSTPSTLKTWLDEAWSQHAEQPQAVADRIGQGIALRADGSAPVAELARLAEHVMLGHLDQPRALHKFMGELLMAGGTPDDALSLVLQRTEFGMMLAGHVNPEDDADAGSELPPDEQLRACGQAMLARTRHQDWAGVEALLDQALELTDMADDEASRRALAIITNNLASDLRYYRPVAAAADTHKRHDQVMLQAARMARSNWGLAGGWLETERAEYQLALCHAAAGDGERALDHARDCLAICQSNGADAYELFFAHEALATGHAAMERQQRANAEAQRAAMRQLLDAVADDGSRAYARATLDKLETALLAER